MRTDRIHLLIIGSIVLAIGTMVVSYYQGSKNKEARDWVDHTYEVIYQATEFLSVLKDAETGQRGYLITGDTSYLKPYHNSVRNLNWHFNNLKQLVRDNPEQEDLLVQKVQPAMDLKIRLLKSAITAYDEKGSEQAFAITRSNTGKQAMDSLRYYVYVLSNREHVLLAQRHATLDRLAYVIDLTRYSNLGVIILVSLLALLALVNRQKSNVTLVKQLRQFNKSLEVIVDERTRALEEKNKAAEVLNEELRQSVEELTTMHETLQDQNKLTEAALAEVNDLYDYSPCGYHSSDADNVVIRINATALKWLGYAREEIVGKMKYRDLLSPGSKAILPPLLKLFQETGKVNDVELELVRKDGSIMPVLLSGTAVFDAQGKFIMSRAVVFDLTERKKMESDLKNANDKMLHIMSEKNSFLAMASHDLKSPLNSMQGLLNLLKLGADNLTADQKDNINLILSAARNMRAMIEKLLDLNRIEQGKSMVQKKEFDLIEIILRTRTEAQALASKKKIQIIAEGIPSSIRMISDAAIIHQILENLVSNAVKFSHPEKRVTLCVQVLDDSVVIEVGDEGPGIKPEEAHKVFGKFQKLSARPTGGETSTGLGLSIVKQLVAALDGKISFKSEPGVATVFTVVLPLK